MSRRRWTTSRRADAVGDNPIGKAFALLADNPGLIPFSAGAPDPHLLPLSLVETAVGAALTRHGARALQYGMTAGLPTLIDVSRAMLAGRGINCRHENCHIATGSSGALNNICMALIDPGDAVLVENPTFAPALATFRAYGAQVHGVACDQDGLLPDALEASIVRTDASLAYVLPTFQNPTGRTMPDARRSEIADVVRRRGILLIEDDIYWDLRYRGEPSPALWSYAPEQTVYLTSLSKTLAPALRIGIVVIPEPLVGPVLNLKGLIDMQTSSLTQAIAVEIMRDGSFRQHLDAVVERYAAKMSGMTGALHRHLPPGFEWTTPDGGLFTWIRGPRGFDAIETMKRAVDGGVAFLPGNLFHADTGVGRSTMRLSTATVDPNDIDRGIATLGKLCTEAIDA